MKVILLIIIFLHVLFLNCALWFLAVHIYINEGTKAAGGWFGGSTVITALTALFAAMFLSLMEER